MHIDSFFAKPNTWIMDMENYWWHNLHLANDGQSQWCSLIPVAQLCNNCLRQSQVLIQPPLPLLMLKVWATVFTFFMNEDRTSLMNSHQFVAPDEPNYLLCCVCGNDGNLYHPSQNCQLLLNGYQCFKCLRLHLRVDYHNYIPHSLNNYPKCHLLHNGQTLGNVPLHEGRYGVDCLGQIWGEWYQILLWAIWCCNPLDMHKAMLELKNIIGDEELPWWMGLKASCRFITNFTWLVDACIQMLEQNNHKKKQF